MQNKKIAITGGIGSGKSCAARIVKECGYPVFSCDEIYSQLCTESAFLSKLGTLFPGSVKEGKLDRPFLSRLVFENPLFRRTLNEFTHPLILDRLFAEMDRFPLSFAEVPLLFESNAQDRFDCILVIARDKEERIRAVIKRDGLNEAQARARLNSQRDWENLPPNAHVVFNNADLYELRKNICIFLEKIV